MPWGLKRYYGAGDLHFITCSCYQRQPLLGTAQRRNLFSLSYPRVFNSHTLPRESRPPRPGVQATATELEEEKDVDAEGVGAPISRVFCEKWGFSSRIGKNLKPSPENRAPRPGVQATATELEEEKDVDAEGVSAPFLASFARSGGPSQIRENLESSRKNRATSQITRVGRTLLSAAFDVDPCSGFPNAPET